MARPELIQDVIFPTPTNLHNNMELKPGINKKNSIETTRMQFTQCSITGNKIISALLDGETKRIVNCYWISLNC